MSIESRPCPCCGQDSVHPGWGPADTRLCISCGTATLPAGETSAEDYDADYFTGDKQDGVDYEASKRQMQLINHARLDYLQGIAGRPPAGSKLFELGCALGFFLEAARERGWEGYGVEISSFAASKASERFGDRIVNGTMGNLPSAWSGFDLAAAFHVFEHLVEPALELEAMAKISKPGAWLLFEVPDFSSSRAQVERDKWQYWLPGEHLNYFTRRGLEAMLASSGWEVQGMKATSFTRLMGGIDRAGLKGLREFVLKNLFWLGWVKKTVLFLRHLAGQHDCVLVLARRKT